MRQKKGQTGLNQQDTKKDIVAEIKRILRKE